MKKQVLISGLLLAVCLLLSACWDQRPLEDQALIAGIGIDLYPANPNLLNFSLVYPLDVEDKRQGEKIELIAADNLGQAINTFERQNPQQFAGGKVRVVAFGADAARQGLAGLLDYIQLPTLDDNAFVVVTERAYDLWTVQLPETERNALQIQSMLRNAQQEGSAMRVTMGQLVTEATALGMDAVVPMVKRLDDWRLQADGAALFQDLQMVDTISQEELHLLMLLRNRIPEVAVVANVGVNEELSKPVVELSLFAPKSRIKPRLEDGQMRVSIDFSASCILDSYELKVDLNDPEAARSLTRHFESYLLAELERFIAKLQELRVDPLGVGKRLRAQSWGRLDPAQLREQWAQAQIEISVQLRLSRPGTLNKSITQSP